MCAGFLTERTKALGVYEKPPEPLLMGRHLIQDFKMKPSPKFGEILKGVFELQLDGKVTNFEEAVEAVKELI